jgi:hypothetical protein
MADATPHPSFLELDRAALGGGAPETALHLNHCARCQSYARTVQTPPPLAPWIAGLQSKEGTPGRMPPLLWLLGGGLAAAVVLVAVLMLWPAARAPDNLQGRLFASKGSPAVALYIKREERVALWDGRSAIQVGDRIQLEVAPGGFSRLTVASIGDETELLYAGPIEPARPAMLPVSFLVDARPGAERLVLGLSRRALTAEALVAAAAAHQRDESLWTTELVLTKETPRGEHP